jgi:hypothetical protein
MVIVKSQRDENISIFNHPFATVMNVYETECKSIATGKEVKYADNDLSINFLKDESILFDDGNQGDLLWNTAIPSILFRFSSLFTYFIEPSKGLSCLCSVKVPYQHLTMCALFLFFLMPIRCPGIPVVYRLL